MKNLVLWIVKWIWGLGKKCSKGVAREMAIFMLIMTVLAFTPGPIGQWAFNFWISVDQLGNSLTLGDPDETISSRLGKWSTAEDPGMFRDNASGAICFFLNLLDENHCINSIEYDEGENSVASPE